MTQSTSSRFRTEVFEHVTVVSPVDERIVDDFVIEELRQQLLRVIEEGHTRLLVNFAEVKFMASVLIARLFELHKKVKTANGTLKFCCVDPDLRVVFKVIGLDKLVEIYYDEQTAIDSF